MHFASEAFVYFGQTVPLPLKPVLGWPYGAAEPILRLRLQQSKAEERNAGLAQGGVW
jgi:hypothetical protein